MDGRFSSHRDSRLALNARAGGLARRDGRGGLRVPLRWVELGIVYAALFTLLVERRYSAHRAAAMLDQGVAWFLDRLLKAKRAPRARRREGPRSS